MRLRSRERGFTLLEILAVVLILGILAGVALPRFMGAFEAARRGKAVAELRNLQYQIEIYRSLNENPPSIWDDLGLGPIPKDPWGYDYVYQNHAIVSLFLFRTDGPLVAVNSDYDLYSVGKDGLSLPNILLAGSKDDILRADDGGFFGAAEDY